MVAIPRLKMTNAREIQQWTLRVHQHLPEADVRGVLREGDGLLIMYDGPASAERLAHLETNLLRAGVQRWHWTAVHGQLKLRVQWTKSRSWWPLLAVAGLATLLLYDVHLAETARRWLGANA